MVPEKKLILMVLKPWSLIILQVKLTTIASVVLEKKCLKWLKYAIFRTLVNRK